MDWDRRSVEQLRAAGSLKWSAYGEAIGAWVAEMDFGVAPAIRAALHSHADSELFGYAPQWLERELARATDAYYARHFGWSPGGANVVPVGDVMAGLGAVLDFYTRPGSAVVLPTPAYMPFLTYPLTKDRPVIQVPMLRGATGWRLDLAGIDAALEAGGGVVILCNPHNPIGKVYSSSELHALAEVVGRHEARVFADEIHASITYDRATHLPYAGLSEQAARQAITATAASKAFNIPGLKCAQLLFSNPADGDVWREHGFFASHGASVPGMLATVAAYDEAAAWRDEVVRYLQGNRDLLGQAVAEGLGNLTWDVPEGTYLAWLDASHLKFEGSIQQYLLEQAGVALVDGAECGAGFERCLRLNFAMPRPVLRETLERLGAALSRLC